MQQIMQYDTTTGRTK